ncbi:MAG: sulfotransferase domain-containing protein [Arcobacteraceae bacterium]|jgi:hypothetical protein|nr:sulfotransferase domain-containing protein [Arcobacteraceae bacterium]
MQGKEDLYVIGFPKSGNTWLARLLSDITNSNIDVKMENDLINSSENSEEKTGKYLIHKIHIANDLERVLKSKKVYIVRDVRASMVSGFFHGHRLFQDKNVNDNILLNILFHYEILKLNKKWQGSFLARIQHIPFLIIEKLFKINRQTVGNWSEHVEFWTKQQDIVVVRYEDLLENTFIELKRILDELDIVYKSEELNQVVEKQSFSTKKKEFLKKGDTKNAEFLRSGTKESWRELLTPKLQKKIEYTHKDMMDKFGYKIETI